MLPPVNKNATKLDDVYRLNEIIDEVLLSRIETEALTVLSTEPDQLK